MMGTLPARSWPVRSEKRSSWNAAARCKPSRATSTFPAQPSAWRRALPTPLQKTPSAGSALMQQAMLSIR